MWEMVGRDFDDGVFVRCIRVVVFGQQNGQVQGGVVEEGVDFIFDQKYWLYER